MQELTALSDSVLMEQTAQVATREKAATLELLEHLLEVERRGLALKKGYGSVFEYVHKGLGYSEGAAGERVAAMRLLRRVPEAKEMLAAQKLTLTTAAKVQTFVRAIEKSEGRRVEAAEHHAGDLEPSQRTPLALGGATELGNLRLLCQSHNLAEAREAGLALPGG